MRGELTVSGGAPAAPPSPPPESSTPAARRIRPRAFLLLAAVLVAGAALGAAAFWVEQSRADWPPSVERTRTGWRIGTPTGLRPTAVAVSGDVLVWNEGPCTVLLDMDGGHTKLLGMAGSAYWVQPPSASGTTVAWSLLTRETPSPYPAHIWRYDTRSRRRVKLVEGTGVSGAPTVSGFRAAWLEERRGGGQRLIVFDLRTGRRAILVEDSHLQSPLLSGDLLAWVRNRQSEPPVIVVADLGTGRSWRIAPYSDGGTLLVGMALAGRTLVWSRSGVMVDGEDELYAYDLDTGDSRKLPTDGHLGAPAADGDVVVWHETPEQGTRGVVRALRLSTGESYAVATVEGSVNHVYVSVSGDTVAWTVQSESFTGVETAKIGAPESVQARLDRRLAR